MPCRPENEIPGTRRTPRENPGPEFPEETACAMYSSSFPTINGLLNGIDPQLGGVTRHVGRP